MRLIYVVFLCLVALPALAEKRVALVIGNDRYETMRPLRNAANDADTVGEALEKLGFEVFYERDRDRRRMERALEDLEYDGEGADVAVVYFAGHGFEVGGDNRLLPVDGDGESLETLMETSLSLGDIRARVARIAPVAVVLVDACRVDPFEGAEEGRAAVALKAGEAPGFAAVPRAEGTLIGFSTAPGAVALDGEGENSPFAAALARHLETPGLEVRSVLTLVQQEVYDRTRGAQLPYVESALPRLFFAAGQSDALPERERLLLAMADLTPEVRAEVERVASEAEVPLAPIFGALLANDLSDASPSERGTKLAEAAAAFVATRAQLRQLSAQDGAVAEARQAAEARLELGDFTGALGALDEAIALDRASGDALMENLVARRMSEAETLRLKAGVARTRLDYALAMQVLAQAGAIHEELVALDPPEEARIARIELFAEAGELFTLLGDHAAALGAYQGMRNLAGAEFSANPEDVPARRRLYLAFVGIAKAQKVLGDTGAVREAAELAGRALRKGEGPEAERQYDLDFWEVVMLTGDISMLLGLYGDALADFESATERMQPHAEANGADVEVQHRLAESYERQGDAQVALGEPMRAFDTYWKGLEIYGRLPRGAGGRDDLAVGRAAMKAGKALVEAGEPESGLKYLERAEKYLREKFEADPQRAALRLALGQTLAGQAMAHNRVFAVEPAEAAAGEALEVLAGAASDSDVQYARYEGLFQLGLTLSFKGRQAEALDWLEQAREVMDVLRETNPTNTGWIYESVRLDKRIAHHLSQAGDRETALKRLLAARDLIGILVDQQEDNLRWRQLELDLNLAIEQHEMAAGGDESALKSLLVTRSHIVLTRMWFLLRDTELTEAAWLLGLGELRRGQTLFALGEAAESDESLRNAYDWLTVAATKMDPLDPNLPSAKAQRAEAVATLGELELTYGSVENAVAWHRIAVDLRAERVENAPDSLSRRWLLSVSHEQLGNALAAQGERDEAIAEHETARDMRLALLKEAKMDYAITWGLFVSYYQLADLGVEPEQNFALALDVLEQMEAKNWLTAEQAEYLAVTRDRIAQIGEENQTDTGAAESP
ncbi:caspase family protein [Vannielia litorea]|uniref:caspase family protein n=1 Tax=Vannielia litorea TaxID=1217970 RepID=UPI001BCF6BED|nr:caspase family protein [Vannielia litorea]MBS8226165.1 caspase family protein [Vannielia litorea]